jgi:hypothetical protein
MQHQPLLTLIPQQNISKLTKYTLFLAKNYDEIQNKSNENQTSDAYDLDRRLNCLYRRRFDRDLFDADFDPRGYLDRFRRRGDFDDDLRAAGDFGDDCAADRDGCFDTSSDDEVWKYNPY